MKRIAWLIVGFTCLASACFFRRTPETPEVPTPSSAPVSTLGPGDIFEVKVFDEADLNGVYRVSSSGTINFPLVGKVEVAGMSSSDAADLIQDKLAKRFVKNPQLSIFVKEYNSKKVSVFGQVNKPGMLNFEEGMTVIQAVSMAGGFTNPAAKNELNVIRLVSGEEKKYVIPVEAIAQGKAKNFFLDPGDIVYVPESIW